MTVMAQGYSINIGLNSVDPKHYAGWDGQLQACEADAEDMISIANAQGFSRVRPFLTKDATRAKVLAELGEAASVLQAGDLLLFTYSGHGGQLPDMNGDEDDGLDETWCLYDGELVDDSRVTGQAWLPQDGLGRGGLAGRWGSSRRACGSSCSPTAATAAR